MPRYVVLAALLAAALALGGCKYESEKEYGVVNTPVIISQLTTGAWERSYGASGEFKGWMRFNPNGSGEMQPSSSVPQSNITYRVDGLHLTIQYYFDEKIPNNWRTRTMEYRYRLSGDTLVLTRVHYGDIQTWRRIKG